MSTRRRHVISASRYVRLAPGFAETRLSVSLHIVCDVTNPDPAHFAHKRDHLYDLGKAISLYPVHTEGFADRAEPLTRCARVEVLEHTLSGRLGPLIGGKGCADCPSMSTGVQRPR
ncbi:hypothetical protein IG631_23436 [Alternaria alternata]|nr:hypothetical protein IG631_23436 [Alternaria alternata]